MIRPLETARLLLRPLELAYAEPVQRIFSAMGVVEFLAKSFTWPYPDDDAITYLRDAAMPTAVCLPSR